MNRRPLEMLEVKLKNFRNLEFEFVVQTFVLKSAIVVINEGLLEVFIVVVVHLSAGLLQCVSQAMKNLHVLPKEVSQHGVWHH